MIAKKTEDDHQSNRNEHDQQMKKHHDMSMFSRISSIDCWNYERPSTCKLQRAKEQIHNKFKFISGQFDCKWISVRQGDEYHLFLHLLIIWLSKQEMCFARRIRKQVFVIVAPSRSYAVAFRLDLKLRRIVATKSVIESRKGRMHSPMQCQLSQNQNVQDVNKTIIEMFV